MSKYYDDHLEAAENDISSRNFCNLVDAAVALYEEEQHKRLLGEKDKSKSHTKVKILSEDEEEQREKSFFHLFPRKRRSLVVTKRVWRNPEETHQNVNGASTSSSSLLDLNTIPVDCDPRNPHQCFLSAHSERNHPQNPHSSSTLPADYNAAEFETEMRTNPQNPNSQLSCLTEKTSHKRPAVQDRNPSAARKSKKAKVSPSSSTLLIDCNTAEFEKTEMTTNAQNRSSSCLRERTSRKRRAVQDRNISRARKAKKPMVPSFSWIGRAIPECLIPMMESMKKTRRTKVIEGNEVTEGPRLIFEKKLTKTDVKPQQSRLLMPFKTLIRNDFLTPVESSIVAEEDDNEEGLGAILVNQQNVKWGLILMRRLMEKKSGRGTLNYALICGWNEIVESNGLKTDDDISIWYFRLRGILCFALVLPPPPHIAQSTSSSLAPCLRRFLEVLCSNN
ncbi:unnamed protein product [Thlaspi arvense]|uniref:TF-B3 domain-containing protein n=1 Tax=Thlaspi arvense TaxID=13288 RepID=A0AAU9RBK5_THLAR|nr:unnamed protein product [Thlaspi arvense]